jgi:hypothetical protein
MFVYLFVCFEPHGQFVELSGGCLTICKSTNDNEEL